MKIDISGQTFGNLTVLKESRRVGSKTKWLCRCGCGNEVWIRRQHLVEERTKSCGCQRYPSKYINGRSREYASWVAMLDRCTNPRNRAWKYYGGRGLLVHEAWKDFEVFYQDLGPRPAGMTLGRINNALGYGPENCRWETPLTQARNRSNTQYVKWQGKTWLLTDLADFIEMPRATLRARVKGGWDIELAVTSPVGGKHKRPELRKQRPPREDDGVEYSIEKVGGCFVATPIKTP